MLEIQSIKTNRKGVLPVSRKITRLSQWRLLMTLAVLVASVSTLGACSETRKALGQSKEAPDEFSVYSRAPLSLPPEYGLRPPEPGAPRPQEADTQTHAKSILLSSSSSPRSIPSGSNQSPGLQALLSATGANSADPSIRQLVDAETRSLAADQKELAHKLLFWQKAGEFGTAVDAKKETDRLRQNQALGRPVNEGEVPIIERKKSGLFR